MTGPRRRRSWSRGPAALLVVAAAVAALVGVGTATTPDGTGTTTATTTAAATGATTGAAGTAATTVPVVGATAACPAVTNGNGRSSRVDVATAPPAGSGVVALGVLGGALEPLPLRSAGQVVQGLAGDVAQDAVVVRAQGDLAGGLMVTQRDRGLRGASRGRAETPCLAATGDSWFVGGSSGRGERSSLVLVNPEDEPALVDVRLWSAEGPVDARAGQGLVVEARSRTVLAVDELAPGRTGLAGHVVATRGRVLAAVRHTRGDGGRSRGVEWSVASPPPTDRVTVAGMPAGPGARTVLVTNPGEEEVTVRLRVTTADGQFVPTGEDAVSVPAGTTIERDLTDEATSSPLSVEVQSEDGPVLAAGVVAQTQRGRPAADFAYAGPGLPLTGPALLASAPASSTTGSTLVLAAPEADARVVLTPVPPVGAGTDAPDPRTVDVPGGSAVAVPLGRLLGTQVPYALEVRPAPGSGPVLATRHVREQGRQGPLASALVLRAALPPVVRPAVAADPDVAGAG